MFGFVLVVGFFVLIFIGVPIACAIGLVSVSYFVIQGDMSFVTIMASKMFSGINSFELLAIPLFILAGDLLYAGKISQTLVNLAGAFVGQIRGGMAMVTTVACALFGAVSGSGPATTAAIGAVVAEPLEKQGYPRSFSAATIAASGPLGILIPPSVLMVIFGCTTGTPIGKLLMAGIGPGLLYALLMCIYQYFICKKKNWGTVSRFSVKKIAKAFREAILALLVPVIILGGIYSGIFTPTEAAAVAVAYALVIGLFVYRSISVKTLPSILKGSAITMASVMFITGNISFFGYILTRERIPETLAALALRTVGSATGFMVITCLILFVAGMIEAGSSCILLLAPLLFPISQAFGIDPVYYGAIFVADLAIGMITPPVAATLYVAQRICKIDISRVVGQLLPYMAVQSIGLALCILFPQIVMFLPNL